MGFIIQEELDRKIEQAKKELKIENEKYEIYRKGMHETFKACNDIESILNHLESINNNFGNGKQND